MNIPFIAVLAATLTIATPLVFAAIGSIFNERAGVMNLGIEGIMYAGAFTGFLAAAQTGSALVGTLVAVVAGALAGALMGLLTVTLGVNQHVAGLGMTLLLVAACDFANRVMFSGGDKVRVDKFGQLFQGTGLFAQYPLTYIALLVLAPLVWFILKYTGYGLRLRAAGENPEAADVAGISVPRTRYSALIVGGALMALGGSFLTLSLLGSFTIDIVSGRGWICVALVIFGRWRVWPIVAGALLFGFADALQLQLAITPLFAAVPNELLIAFPYLVIIAALAVWGRGVRYPGAYLKAYHRA